MSKGPHRKLVRHIEGHGHLHELTFTCYRRKPLLTNDPWRRILARSIDDACHAEGFGLIAFVFMPEGTRPSSRRACEPGDIQSQPFPGQSEAADIEEDQTHSYRDPVKAGRAADRPGTPGKRCFRFWQEGPGFDRNIFSPEALSASIDYIHMNPVKLQLCARVDQWKWSSARFYLNDQIDLDLPQLARPDPMWFETSGVQVEHR